MFDRKMEEAISEEGERMSNDPSKMSRAQWQKAARASKEKTVARIQKATGQSRDQASASWAKRAEKLYRKRFKDG